MRADDPNCSTLKISFHRPTSRGGMFNRDLLHPRDILQVADVPQFVDRIPRDDERPREKMRRRHFTQNSGVAGVQELQNSEVIQFEFKIGRENLDLPDRFLLLNFSATARRARVASQIFTPLRRGVLLNS